MNFTSPRTRTNTGGSTISDQHDHKGINTGRDHSTSGLSKLGLLEPTRSETSVRIHSQASLVTRWGFSVSNSNGDAVGDPGPIIATPVMTIMMTITDGPLLHFLTGRVMVRASARSALLDPLPPLSGLGLMLSLVTTSVMLTHVPRKRPRYQRLT